MTYEDVFPALALLYLVAFFTLVMVWVHNGFRAFLRGLAALVVSVVILYGAYCWLVYVEVVR